MSFKTELAELLIALRAAGISDSNLHSHHAKSQLALGYSVQDCCAEAIQLEASARMVFVVNYLDPWCKRHGLTHRQALTVLFDDGAHDPSNPARDRVTANELHTRCGPQNDFAEYLFSQLVETTMLLLEDDVVDS